MVSGARTTAKTQACAIVCRDDFNALAANDLRGDLGHGHVYRVAPDPDEPDLLPSKTEVDILGGEELTLATFIRRLAEGGRIVERTLGERNGAELSRDRTVLFVVDARGHLHAKTTGARLRARSGNTVIELVAAPSVKPSGVTTG
jgi:hypothetical protein